jgi:DNA-binding transcriptional ArsR family regulator
MLHSEPLDRAFSALADPTRRAILERLAKGPASVGELAAPFDISLPAISKHLTVLERARLPPRGRERSRRAKPARVRVGREHEGIRSIREHPSSSPSSLAASMTDRSTA